MQCRAPLDHPDFFQNGFVLSTTSNPGSPLRIASLTPAGGGLALYAPAFFTDSMAPTYGLDPIQEVPRSELLAKCGGPPLPPMEWKTVSWLDFERDFLDFQWEAHEKKMEKVVLSVTQEGPAPSPDRIRYWLEQLLLHTENYPVWIYGYWNENGGMLGASPELLMERKGATLKTMALAGTQKQGFPRLMQDPKECREQAYVIQTLCTALNVPIESMSAPEIRAVSPSLEHLYTSIEASVPEARSTEDLLTLLHPTPALGGFPREQAMTFLKQRDRNRGHFGAPFGLANQIIVAIRGVQWDRHSSRITVGAGILPESVLTSERHELLLKLNAVRHSFSEGRNP